jgi:glyoxylase-like metal-dependent hydrolase (beta-lactamase superfamily II)
MRLARILAHNACTTGHRGSRMSLVVQSFFHAPTFTWSHVASDPETGGAAIIDPVLDYDPAAGVISPTSANALIAYVRSHALHVEWLLETHAHADHLSAGAWLKDQVGGRLAIGAGIIDVQRHFKEAYGLGDDFAADGSEFDHRFLDGDRFRIGGIEAEVIATPGHTSDGVSYRIADVVFVGDTVFSPAAGTARCDFPGGDAAALYRSIQRLYALPPATRVFLCHDYPPEHAEPRSDVPLVELRSGNSQLTRDTSEDDYITKRRQRDATLPLPRLIQPAMQFNLRGGRLPPADAHGRHFFRTAVRFQS